MILWNPILSSQMQKQDIKILSHKSSPTKFKLLLKTFNYPNLQLYWKDWFFGGSDVILRYCSDFKTVRNTHFQAPIYVWKIYTRTQNLRTIWQVRSGGGQNRNIKWDCGIVGIRKEISRFASSVMLPLVSLS